MAERLLEASKNALKIIRKQSKIVSILEIIKKKNHYKITTGSGYHRLQLATKIHHKLWKNTP